MQVSAGLMPFRGDVGGALEVLIAHPGGPFFARKDEGAWSVVKGLVEAGEDLQAAARREFAEETGWQVPGDVQLIELDDVRLKSGKVVRAWAFRADYDPDELRPGTFEMEWRGSTHRFPEIDRVAWASPDEAGRLLNPAQAVFVERLVSALEAPATS